MSTTRSFEKYALGGSILVAVALAYFGYAKLGDFESDFQDQVGGKEGNTTSVVGSKLADETLRTMNQPQAWSAVEIDKRPVNLLTSVPLVVSRDKPGEAMDFYKAAPVYPPIPNTWWLQYGIDADYDDALTRDPDQDGFTNLEEFEAKTDPSKVESHPVLALKVKYLRDESVKWLLEPGYKTEKGEMTFKYADTTGQQNKVSAVEPIAPGGLFFKKGAMQDRFKFVKLEEKEVVNSRTNLTEKNLFVTVEDQRPNKKGVTYEIPSGMREAQKPDYFQYDRTAVFTLEAMSQSGKEMKVEENTRFSLPADAVKKEYLLKKVTPEAIVIEYTDSEGKTSTYTIAKGSVGAQKS